MLRNAAPFVITHLAWSCTGQRNQWPPVHHQPQTWCTGTSHWSGRTLGFPAHSSDQWWARNQRAHRGPRCGRTYTPRMALWNTCRQRTSRCTVGETLGEGERSREGEMGAEEVKHGTWVRGYKEKDESLTLYNVDTFPLSRVFLRVVGWGEIPSFGLLYPGPTLPSWCHTWVVLHWKHR